MSSEDRDGSVASNRDDALERAWREASTERPPPRLDAALIAAARKSVATREGRSQAGEARPRSMKWLARWQPVLAAAAVAGLALVLVPMLPREQDPAPTMQSHESDGAPAVESGPASSPTPEDAVVSKPPAPSAGTMTERRERAVPIPDRPTSDREVPPPPAPGEVPARAASSDIPAPAAAPAPGSSTRSAESPPPRRDTTADAAAAFGEAARPSQEAATWAARIEALHAAGAIDAAARELRAFRAFDPQADRYLPDSLRDWALTVEPFPADPARE